MASVQAPNRRESAQTAPRSGAAQTPKRPARLEDPSAVILQLCTQQLLGLTARPLTPQERAALIRNSHWHLCFVMCSLTSSSLMLLSRGACLLPLLGRGMQLWSALAS